MKFDCKMLYTLVKDILKPCSPLSQSTLDVYDPYIGEGHLVHQLIHLQSQSESLISLLQISIH